MKLTALEIKQQTFEKSLRGYDVAEVQAFLNIISSEWEHMVSRNRELEQQIGALQDKLKHYERVEQALHETLQTAKESADHKITEARTEARNKIEKAEIEAENIVRSAQQERQQIRQSILSLLDRRKEIIGNIRSYLELAQESLNQFARDDASIYRLPEEEQPAARPKADKKEETDAEEAHDVGSPVNDEAETAGEDGAGDTEEAAAAPEEGEEKDKKSPATEPGDDEIDSIIDEID